MTELLLVTSSIETNSKPIEMNDAITVWVSVVVESSDRDVANWISTF